MKLFKKVGLLVPALFAFMLGGAILSPAEASAQNCPGPGRGRLDWYDNSGNVKLATSTWDVLVSNNTCSEHSLVSAKVLLTNNTGSTQTPECWLSSSLSADWAKVTLAPWASAVLHLEIGNKGPAYSKLECRGNAYQAVTATWSKLQTQFFSQVVVYGTN